MFPETDALRAELRRARTFEDGARLALEHSLQVAERALLASRWARSGKVLRGMLHLRSEQGYEGIAVREAGGDHEGGAPVYPFRPSSTAWEWVHRTGDPVFVDVRMATLEPLGGEPQELPTWRSGEGASPAFTARRMMQREANFLWALPLTGEAGETVGMLSFELACLPATGSPFIWPDCAPVLRAIADLTSEDVLPMPRGSAPNPDTLLPVVGPSMVKRVETLGFFAESGETLLLSGATGTGKSRIARWCHARSARAAGPFEHLDLMTIPTELQTAHLFGWKRGAFTGAVDDRVGAVALAEGGTLFIDEIAKLSLDAQASLLQLLDNKQYRPVGDRGPMRQAEVRFIVGSNANLREEVAAGRFREDLFFRINVLPVTMPPLRERRDEVLLWAQYMLGEIHRAAGVGIPVDFTEAAERALMGYGWPGNLRQLDNVVRRAYTFARLHARRQSASSIHVDLDDIRTSLVDEPADAVRVGLGSRLEEFAACWVDLTERAQRLGVPFPIDLLDGVKGAALEEAIRRLGSLDDALTLLGRGNTVKGRNQQKYKQKRDKTLSELREALEQLSSAADDER
ncbi:MAG: sigma-54-dependent Fis family transcriptional regulator [Alphaproteobacteria bacterium]|nr:sigma-54-dependent Fis family transcriptional regulator [Alphaproteobacteria bacterium]MCB9797513.1 sigma-54-dependent Fis family transcriptional regulator [Alphaproteobacteria bacterium]